MSVVVVDLLKESLHLSSVLIHSSVEFGHLISHSCGERSSSLINYSLDGSIIISDETSESIPDESDISETQIDLLTLESSSLVTFCLTVGFKSRIGISDGSIDSSLLFSEKSQEVKSVVRVLLPLSVDSFLVVKLLPCGKSSIYESFQASLG